MHVKGHAMFKFRCFWNCSFIAHMFLAWFLQSWKPTRFFIVTGWPMILISFKMSGTQFTLVMASSHQSISFFFWLKIHGCYPRKSRCCSYSKSSAFVKCWRFPNILKFKDGLLTVAANGTSWLARLIYPFLLVKFLQVLNRAPENLVTNLVRLAWCLSLISDSSRGSHF